ncbi:MAG: PAN domain-containing protein [Pseudomonadota bacterium]
MSDSPRVISRRSALFALGGAVVGGGIATAVGLSFRSEIKRLLGLGGGGAETLLSAVKSAGADDGWLLTEEDRAELARRDSDAQSDVMEVRAHVELHGGDYSSRRMRSLQECVSTCEAEARCQTFTFSQSTHPDEGKRQMCWLKEETGLPAVTDAAHYVSGTKAGW